MFKMYTVQKIISEMLKRFPLTNNDIELTKNELLYKTDKELEQILEKLQEENK